MDKRAPDERWPYLSKEAQDFLGSLNEIIEAGDQMHKLAATSGEHAPFAEIMLIMQMPYVTMRIKDLQVALKARIEAQAAKEAEEKNK